MRVVSREDYRWSSYRATAGYEEAPSRLAVSPVLSRLRDHVPEAQQLYREFVSEKIGNTTSVWDNVVNGIFLGGESWLAKMRTLVESKMRSDAHPRMQTAVGRPRVEQVVDAVAEVFDISATDVHDGHGGAPRMIMAWLARYECIAKLEKIASVLRLRSGGHISGLIAHCDRELAGDPRLRQLVDRCIARLRPDPPPWDEIRLAYWPAIPLIDSIGERSALYLV